MYTAVQSAGIRVVRGRAANVSLSLGVSKGLFSFAKENSPFGVGSASGAAIPPSGGQNKKTAFLKNPLDKWAPRAIMQPTSEELQTYDGEK